MKTISKKILAGTIAASFVLGTGFVGALHNQAYADTVSGSTVQKSDGFKDRGGRQGGFYGGSIVKEAAAVLGVDESTLQASLKEGKTLLEVAQAAGLTEDDFLAKLVAAETTAINEKVTAGKLTQEQADKLITDLSTRLKQQIENKGFGNKGEGFRGGEQGGRGGFQGGKLDETAATVLGVDVSTIQASLKEGKTLLEIAQAAGLTENDFLAKLTDAQKTAIAAQVTAGTITQAEADKITADLATRLKQHIENARPEGGQENGGEGHRGGGFGGGFLGNSEALTTILGITQDELKTELDSGKTIAEIAAAKGISEDDLISKLKDSLTDTLKKFVEDKHQKPEAPAADATDSTSTN